MASNLYRKGKGKYSTSEMSSILEVFEEVWGPSFRDRVHAVPAYPRSSKHYKKPCNLMNMKHSFLASPKWEGIYPRIAVTISKVRSVKDEQFLVGLFDCQIVTIDIDSVYDYETKMTVDLSETSEREYVREAIAEEFRKLSPRFIIEDSTRGFHVMYWCRTEEHYSYRQKYQILGDHYIVGFDIISCRPVKETKPAEKSLPSGNPSEGKPDGTAEKGKEDSRWKDCRVSGGYTLLGYGKQIPSYSVKYVGSAHSLSRIPWQFTDSKQFYGTRESALKDLEYQKSLKDLEYREQIKNKIFHSWYLEKPRSRREEIEMQKMIDRYIAAVKINEAMDSDKGYVKDRKGRNVDFRKLSPDIPRTKLDAVRRSTIDSVYKFYDYLNTLPLGTSFDRESIVDEFVTFCMEKDLEMRGMWSHTDGKPLYSNRLYKVLLNLSAKDEKARLTVTHDTFCVEEHSHSKEPEEDAQCPSSGQEFADVPVQEPVFARSYDDGYGYDMPEDSRFSDPYGYGDDIDSALDSLMEDYANPP